ncbi:hypothetical protein L1987_06732 [Smallanthus sonchifolius]|uniref:Uncharacterized protein n=1 Tax=Smallanthus sonchifolius TaxID=185202 RepID=A0ACB9JZ52_9ASTR|nr:hypothetical protein L1987_06732 [Smallanthus sonchifolius]
MDVDKDPVKTHTGEQFQGEQTEEHSNEIFVCQGSGSNKGKTLMIEPEIETITLTDSYIDIEKDHEMLKLLGDINDIANIEDLNSLVIPEFDRADKIIYIEAGGHLIEGFSGISVQKMMNLSIHQIFKKLLNLKSSQHKRV